MNHVIILDTETKRLTDQATAHARFMWARRHKTVDDCWRKLSFSMSCNGAGWNAVDPSTDGPPATFAQIIRRYGPPALAPSLQTLLRGDARVASAEELLKAVEDGFYGISNLIYDPVLHEVSLHSPKERWDREPLIRRLGLSVAVTWDSRNGFRRWSEIQAPALVDELNKYRVIVGANVVNFDFLVLERYVPGVRAMLGFRSIDILHDPRWFALLARLSRPYGGKRIGKRIIERRIKRLRLFPLGDIDNPHRFRDRYHMRANVWDDAEVNDASLRKVKPKVSLQLLARGTLGIGKLMKSNNAPELFRNEKIEELYRYCETDVQLTRDIFFHGCETGAVRVNGSDYHVRWSFLAERLRRLRRTTGPETQEDVLRFQRRLLANMAEVFPVEKYFRK